MGRLLVMLGVGACSYAPGRVGTDTDGGLAMPDTPETPGFVRRINVGGAAHTGTDFQGEWEEDVLGAVSGCGPSFWPVTGGIKGTVDDPLFTTHVYGQPTLTCAVANIPPGDYRVTLLFGPTFYGMGCNTAVAQHFSIALEGTMVDPDYDVTAATLGCVREVGTGNAAPVMRSFDVTIDGTLDIVHTAPQGEASMLSAIEIVAR